MIALFILPLNDLVIKYLLSTYYVSGIMQDVFTYIFIWISTIHTHTFTHENTIRGTRDIISNKDMQSLQFEAKDYTLNFA